MNQATLGALRAVGTLVFFAVATTLISLIPDVLTQLPYIGGFITPTIAAALAALALAGEHNLANSWGYNLPAGSVAVPKSGRY